MAHRKSRASNPSRVSLTAAFRWLLSEGYPPPRARRLLDEAVHDNTVRLYRDGEIVDSTELQDGEWRVRCEQAADTRWTCTMASNAPQRVQISEFYEHEDGASMVRIVPPPQSLWEVKTSEVEKLGKQTDNPQSPDVGSNPQSLPDRRGRPRKYDWHAIHAEIATRCIDPKTGRVRVREAGLVGDILAWCQEKFGKEPPRSDLAEAVRQVCAARRTLQK
jgi:hypothetical protein